jgi:tetratricopeptide (TPR) repeat protein
VYLRFSRFFVASFLVFPCWYLTAPARAQQPMSGGQGQPGIIGLNSIVRTSNLDIYLKAPDGKPLDGVAVVTLVNLSGEVYRQGTAKAGYARFGGVAATQYKVLVVAPGFEREMLQVDVETVNSATVNIQLRAMSAEDASLSAGVEALPPKAQKELGKVLAAMHANNLAEARSHLEIANRIAPNRAEVNYLFGLYSSQSKDFTTAKSYWTRTLELNPKHFLALLFLGETLLRENNAAEALPYMRRAVEAGPTSWRAHALLADAELRQGSTDDAIQDAERALELGHGQAENVQPFLAGALARRGEKDRAIALLKSYAKDHPADATVTKQLENIQSASAPNAASGSKGINEGLAEAAMVEAASRPEISNWLPPDVDEKVPAVEAGASCKLEDVLRETGKRIEEFVGNVDRFTATEFLTHESINKWGMASSPEQRKFDYLVSVQEVKPGFLNVDEYRSSNHSAVDFPGGIETHGLPALVLIFHPYNAGSFEMSCEGLTRWNGGLAWQVHFRQRSDKPNRVRAYRIGLEGPAYPIALKGRAWIAADSFQITRLETDLIAPVPEIRLIADHTAIEYGPVHFKNRKVDMWLPHTAEVYYDWRGRRTYRRHSFSNYLLFSVDDKQRISAPKAAQESPSDPPSGPGTAQP